MNHAEIIVIGGGATGAGVLRDAALRGFTTLLLERGALGGGTTLRQHGVLHSGARYAVSDPEAARECARENRVLRRIAGTVLIHTGGLVISTLEDDPAYVDLFRRACDATGIPTEELQPNDALRLEPALTPRMRAAFRVPDAYCHAQSLIAATVRSAQDHGGKVSTHRRIVGFERRGAAITGVRTLDEESRREEVIGCDLVVNAAGAWAGQIGDLAGIPIPMKPDKGSMLIVAKRLSTAILHRCHLPSDGDIIVPLETTSVVGTTSNPVANPDTLTATPEEIDLLLREGEVLVPGLSGLARIGTCTGVRPLFGGQRDGRHGGRGFVLLEHGSRDGIDNVVTIVSGKLTTHRLMAEATMDTACRILGVDRTCRTATEALV